MDKESPNFMRTTLEKRCYRAKGEIRYERNVTVEGSNKEEVKEAINYLGARLL